MSNDTPTPSTPPSGASGSGESSAGSVLPPKHGKATVWEIYFPKRGLVHREAVFVASFPEIIYFWPIAAISLVCAVLQGLLGMNPATVGWMWTIVVLFNLLVLVQDFDQKQFVIVVLLGVAALLGVWIVNLYGFSIFQRIASWILSFQPMVSTDAFIVIGFGVLLFFAWGLVSPLFNYWRLEQNEFIHFTQPIGRDMSVSRLGCTVYKEIPDILECLLSFGGGTLIIKKDNQIVASIPNIPFLAFRMETIEHLLSETRVTIASEKRD